MLIPLTIGASETFLNTAAQIVHASSWLCRDNDIWITPLLIKAQPRVYSRYYRGNDHEFAMLDRYLVDTDDTYSTLYYENDRSSRLY
jgi:hypothetical protein